MIVLGDDFTPLSNEIYAWIATGGSHFDTNGKLISKKQLANGTMPFSGIPNEEIIVY